MRGAEIITVERRRRWSLTDKRRIVSEALGTGGSVNAAARRHGLHPSQLFAWCKAAREGLLDDPATTLVAGIGLAPVEVGDKPSEPSASTPSAPPLTSALGRLEIVLRDGDRVVIDATVDAAALSRVLKVLERR